MANTLEICGDDPIFIDSSMENCESCEQFAKDLEDLTDEVSKKQDKLIAGENITISGNTISAKDTKYKAGDNITISSDGTISAVGGGASYTAGDGISISNGKISVNLTKADLLQILGAEEITFSKTDGSGTVSGYFLGKVE